MTFESFDSVVCGALQSLKPPLRAQRGCNFHKTPQNESEQQIELHNDNVAVCGVLPVAGLKM